MMSRRQPTPWVWCQGKEGKPKLQSCIEHASPPVWSLYHASTAPWATDNIRYETYPVWWQAVSPAGCTDVRVLCTYLPLLGVNCSTTWAVVHDPLQYGGMCILNHSELQDKWGLYYFIQPLQWDDITPDHILAVKNGFQILSDFECQGMEVRELSIDYR